MRRILFYEVKGQSSLINYAKNQVQIYKKELWMFIDDLTIIKKTKLINQLPIDID